MRRSGVCWKLFIWKFWHWFLYDEQLLELENGMMNNCLSLKRYVKLGFGLVWHVLGLCQIGVCFGLTCTKPMSNYHLHQFDMCLVYVKLPLSSIWHVLGLCQIGVWLGLTCLKTMSNWHLLHFDMCKRYVKFGFASVWHVQSLCQITTYIILTCPTPMSNHH